MGRHVSRVVPLLFLLFACDSDESPARDAGTTDSGTIDGGRDSGMDGTFDAHTEPTVTWRAEKTTLDVWWPGTPPIDPGRGKLEVYALARTTGACDDEASETVVKLCGITLPTFTNDYECDAYQLTIPDAAWDSPTMPTFTAQTNANIDADAGGIAARVAVAVIGLEVGRDDPWPTSTQIPTVSCSSGTGAACFSDHDDDGMPGVTALPRRDGATYVGPHDDGLCTPGAPFKYRGFPTSPWISTGGGFNPSDRADQINLGFRAGVVAGACEPADGAGSDRLDLAAVGCTVDPTSLDEGLHPDPRRASMDYGCLSTEILYVGDILPQYRVLDRGERPGEVTRPNGWTHNGRDRDIDRSVSEGARTVTVTLDDDTDGGSEPICAQVRAALFQ